MEVEEPKRKVIEKTLPRIDNPRHFPALTSTMSIDLRNLQRSFSIVNLRGLHNSTRIPQLVYQHNNQLGEKEESTLTFSHPKSLTWSELNHFKP